MDESLPGFVLATLLATCRITCRAPYGKTCCLVTVIPMSFDTGAWRDTATRLWAIALFVASIVLVLQWTAAGVLERPAGLNHSSALFAARDDAQGGAMPPAQQRSDVIETTLPKAHAGTWSGGKPSALPVDQPIVRLSAHSRSAPRVLADFILPTPLRIFSARAPPLLNA
jgi:hypothetical protein